MFKTPDFTTPAGKLTSYGFQFSIAGLLSYGGFSQLDTMPASYWILLATMVILYALFQWGQYNQTRTKEHRAKQEQERAKDEHIAALEAINSQHQSLTEQQSALNQLLRTMPPARSHSEFMQSYQRILYGYQTLNWDQSQPLTAKLSEVEEIIRRSLAAIARLLFEYQHRSGPSRCSANIALFRDIEDIQQNPKLLQQITADPRFVADRNDPLMGLKGMLHVCPALSASVGKGDVFDTMADPDPDCAEIFLPVPRSEGDSPAVRSRAIPVAPRVFFVGELVYPDIRALCEPSQIETWDVTPGVAEELKYYFASRAQGRVGSILSYRLVINALSEKPIPFAVLNIHSPEKMSALDDIAVPFIDLVRPVLELQKELLMFRARIKAELGNTR